MELELLSRQLKTIRTTPQIKDSSHCKLSCGDIIGNYEIHEPIGKGRFSTVWSAKNISSGASFAIKVYRCGTDNRYYFENEVKILNRIFEFSIFSNEFPTNIISYMGSFAHVAISRDFSPKIHPCVLFNLAGDSVSKLIKFCMKKYDKGLPLHVVKKIMKDTLTGLSFLHKSGIIHTDIKPSNLLMNKKVDDIEDNLDDLVVSLGDLGTSTFADDIFSQHIGTTHYCAPEVIIEAGYSYPADIWATFAMCFELITGDLLFDVFEECGVVYGEDVDGEALDWMRKSGGELSNKSDMDDNIDTVDNDELANNSDTEMNEFKSTELAYSDHSDSSGSEDEEDMEKINYRYLLLIEKVIGPAPREFTKQARMYYNRRDKLKNNPDIVHIRISELLYANYDLAIEECNSIEEFLLLGLRYIPDERITAEEALQHPFLN